MNYENHKNAIKRHIKTKENEGKPMYSFQIPSACEVERLPEGCRQLAERLSKGCQRSQPPAAKGRPKAVIFQNTL